MRKFKIFSLLLVFVFVGCAHDNDNPVIIHSVPADSIFTEISIFSPSTKQTITFEGGTTYRFETDTVETRYIYSYSNEDYYYHFKTQIFITPGDSVSFKTITKDENQYEVIFEGKNAAHYNYATIKEKSISEEAPDYFSSPDIDLLEYKQQLQVYRNKENEFLNSYKKAYAVSEDFINYASAEIENLYTFKLYQAAYFSKCKIPAGYLDSLIIIQNPLSTFAFEALQFKYIYCSSETDMEQIYNTILNEVSPALRSEILSKFISHFAQTGDRAYKESFLKVMEEIEKTSTDSTLLATVQKYRPFYLLSGTTLPDSILDETFLRSFQSDQKITLRQMLNKHRNTVVYFDFWASWCGPCRYSNRESADNKSYLTERGISVVYISMDEDEKSWLRAAEEDEITQNQYLLLDITDSPLNNYLKILTGEMGIPRFILFNKKHEIEILSAPRPSGCLFEELKELIERIQPGFSKQTPIYVEKITPREEVKNITKTEVLVNNLSKEKSVLINGVHWATCNVDAPGTFAKNPEDAGMFYQWNRKKAWPATGKEVTGWDNSKEDGTIWEKANDPSPAGWRVPTSDEINKLCDRDKVSCEPATLNGIYGEIFTDKTNGNSIFVPAAGFRHSSDGRIYRVGLIGYYWSRNKDSWMYTYDKHNEHGGRERKFYDHNYGFSIRSVFE